MTTVNLYIVLLAAIFVTYVTAQDPPPPPPPATQCKNGTLGIYTECKDCVTAFVCNNAVAVKEKPCPSTTPYCLKGVCGNTKDPNPDVKGCPEAKKYKCTSVGLFPDPQDCTRYFSCKTIDSVVSTTSCPSGQVFSDVTGSCRKATVPADCVTVNCEVTMGNGVFSPYGASKLYYALCTEKSTALSGNPTLPEQDQKSPKSAFEEFFMSMKETVDNTMDEFETFAAAIQYDILVFRCAKGAEFDRTPSISTCVYKCTKEGYLEYSLDKTMYYDCKTVNAAGILKKCEGSTEFDKDLGLCI